MFFSYRCQITAKKYLVKIYVIPKITLDVCYITIRNENIRVPHSVFPKFLKNQIFLCNLEKVESNTIPVQAWTGPEVFRRLRLPDFKTIGT